MAKFTPRVRSKNTSCNDLRAKGKGLGLFPARAVVRLGSITETKDIFPKTYGKVKIVEINTVESIQNSRSKLNMKTCFKDANVPQSQWWDSLTTLEEYAKEKEIPYPILAKRIYGFKGKGMILIQKQEDLDAFKAKYQGNSGYYFEKFHSYAREYRLHVTKDGCIMAWRKLRKSDSEERWYFNSSNCNWVGEDHELFDRPTNWNAIEEYCVKALLSTGLDIGACDVRVQSSSKKNPGFIVIEINSAPALGENGIEIYRDVIGKLIEEKIK